MSRVPYVSRSAQVARGEEPSVSAYQALQDRLDGRSSSPPAASEVETHGIGHVRMHPDEHVFNDDASPPADRRVDDEALVQARRPWKARCKDRFLDMFVYETTRVVNIKNKKTGAIFHIAQFLIIAYVLGYSSQ
jgi:hypothetical protein